MPKDSAGSGSPAEIVADLDQEIVPAILHVDMDAFFASVEVLDNPELAGRPVVVGGSGARGVVASCTYEARAFGVHSAMPSASARALCPHAVFVDGRHARYAEESRRLHEILRAVTPLVEPVGLDEAFLDVTGARRLLGSPEDIAASIRATVRAELSLDCSIGVGGSKLVAKLASRAAKPVAERDGPRPGPGVVVVPAGSEVDFLHPMPVEALPGVGQATARRLHDIGVRSVGDLGALPVEVAVRRLGRAQGTHLSELARGRDPRRVVADRQAKSVGHEQTFPADVYEPAELHRRTAEMADAVASHLRATALSGRTVQLKVRFGDFTTLTRAHTLPAPVDTPHAIAAVAGALLDSLEVCGGVRLLGVSVSALHREDRSEQLAFDLQSGASSAGPPAVPARSSAGTEPPTPTSEHAWALVADAIEAIRSRYGRAAVGMASMVHDRQLTGGAPWGPVSADDGSGGARGPSQPENGRD